MKVQTNVKAGGQSSCNSGCGGGLLGGLDIVAVIIVDIDLFGGGKCKRGC